MKFITLIGCVMYFLRPISTHDPLEGLFQAWLPCFELTEPPPDTCNTSLAESYQAENAKLGYNEPSTLIYLFTPDNPNVAEPLHLCGGKLPPDTTYDPEADTEVFIHGWLDGVCRTAWMREMYHQLKKRGRYNVILVDWSWGNTLDYFLAGSNCRIVGEQVGFTIHNIMTRTGAGPEKFHIIGHSLGAIASGYASRKIRSLRGEDCLIRRITGLDIAGPPYLEAPPEKRTTFKDAKIVDMIHSNGGSCFANAIGDIRQLGHADFYPNGGSEQTPSCYIYSFLSLLKLDLLYGMFTLLDPRLCPHVHSIQFYRASINPQNGCERIGIHSPSYEVFLSESPYGPDSPERAVMGMNYEQNMSENDTIRRTYYLKTGFRCPYYDDSYLTDRRPECANSVPLVAATLK